MVNVPVYGPAEGVPFPCFDHELPTGENKAAFAAMVEEGVRHIVRKSPTGSILHGRLLEP
jgi:hypothetical protein